MGSAKLFKPISIRLAIVILSGLTEMTLSETAGAYTHLNRHNMCWRNANRGLTGEQGTTAHV